VVTGRKIGQPSGRLMGTTASLSAFAAFAFAAGVDALAPDFLAPVPAAGVPDGFFALIAAALPALPAPLGIVLFSFLSVSFLLAVAAAAAPSCVMRGIGTEKQMSM